MTAPLLVFDLDGTLVDSAPDLLATLKAVLDSHGIAIELDPGLRDGIGHGARHLIEFALHRQNLAPDDERLDRIYADFLDHYEANIAVGTRAFPHLGEMLDRFAEGGWRFAVCTNKLEGLSVKLVKAVGLDHRFTAVCGGDTFATRKPDPNHLLETIRSAGGTPEQSVMIGDSRTDLDTARAASVPFIGVSFGYTPVPMADLGPDLLLGSYADLTPSVAAALTARGGGAQSEGERPAQAFA